jgi:hypothetical protein
MRSLAIENFRRSELERWIDDAINLLDAMDDDADLEENGDADWSGYEEELPTRQWSGDGVAKALRLIEASPAASRRADEYADTPVPPLVYDFRGGAGR